MDGQTGFQSDKTSQGETQQAFSQTGFQPVPSSDPDFNSSGFSQTGPEAVPSIDPGAVSAGFSQTGFSQEGFSQEGFSQGAFQIPAATFKPKLGLPPRPKKRIIICCDGTWQSSAHGAQTIPSNVAKLSRSIASEYIDENGLMASQIVYYDAGVGTAMNKLESFWNGKIFNIAAHP